jgi:predicted deacylase
MAELFPIDQIFDNAAYPGLLANAFIDAGIPAFTPEIGAARILDHDMIPKRTSLFAPHMSVFGCKADMTYCTAHVCF